MTVVATKDWYADHLDPIAALLPDDPSYALVAGYGDLSIARRLGFRRFVMAQHGIGQSYSNTHPNYPGGTGNEDVGLFLAPNEHSADRWRRAYPRTPVATVGSPRLDSLRSRVVQLGRPTVAFAWHWELYMTPETRSALPWFRDAMAEVVRDGSYKVIGTGHPRRTDLQRLYAKHGIEYVADFGDVCALADVLVFDNTSAGYEFASTGRPVVVLDAPCYRPEARHGLRFWDAAHVGERVARSADVLPAIHRAFEYRAEDIAAREDALSTVYAYRHGAAQRAADAILEWAA